jgi:hypothetical protein
MFIDPQTILNHGGSPVSTAMLDQADHSVHGKECLSCGNIRNMGEFRRDSSYKEGVRDQCLVCESAPRLSTSEHTHRLREANYNSYAVKQQRWQNQEDWMQDDECRAGRWRHSSEIYSFLKEASGGKLYFMDGRIADDISIFRTYGVPQPHLEGRTFEYTMYMPQGMMPEFSFIEYGPQDQPIKESKRGWRTVLLRMIKSGIITEKQVNEKFGEAAGLGSVPYNRQLWQHRNK